MDRISFPANRALDRQEVCQVSRKRSRNMHPIPSHIRYCSPDEINSGRKPRRVALILAALVTLWGTRTRLEGVRGRNSRASWFSAEGDTNLFVLEGSRQRLGAGYYVRGPKAEENERRRRKKGRRRRRRRRQEVGWEEAGRRDSSACPRKEDLCGSSTPDCHPFRCTVRGSEINGYRGLPPDADTS